MFSRTLAEISARLFGIPLLIYFGDFGAIIPSSLSIRALEVSLAFCMITGIVLKEEKAQLGPTVSFLGVSGTFTRAANGMQREIRLTSDKATKWSARIQESFALTPLAKSISERSSADLVSPTTAYSINSNAPR